MDSARMIRKAGIVVALFCLGWASPGRSQDDSGRLELTGSLRSRVEFWNWFPAEGNSDYAFSGNQLHFVMGQQGRRVDWTLDLMAPVLLGLPDDASAPAPQGALGLGSNYFVANQRKRNAVMVFPKQMFLSLHDLGASEAHTVRLGRFDFNEGAEVTPTNATLAAVKRTRIQQRLIGSFGWSHVGRSYNGVLYSYSPSAGNLTLAAAIPSRGVFHVDGWGFVKAGFAYGAFTKAVNSGNNAGELRVFGIYYRDWRPIGKTDNRPGAIRAADVAKVSIGTFGGDYIHAAKTSVGTLDLLLWGAVQTGMWGDLDHRAGAVAFEGGFQPKWPARLRPWIRAGYFRSTGDSNPEDGRHGTFFQILPTPRIYSRFPFYNLMNLNDAFGELVLRPHAKLLIRADIHGLRLSESSDLWYAGGGASDPWTFGYAGRPSLGGRGLATMYDVSADIQATQNLTLSAYYAYADGGSVMTAIYPNGGSAQFAYLELSYQFPGAGTRRQPAGATTQISPPR